MEEIKMKTDEMKFKANLQEETLNTLKSQIESTNLILKEKQNEALVLEKRLSELNETMTQAQTVLHKIREEYSNKE